MRILTVKTLREFWRTHLQAEQPLKVWYEDVELAKWKSPQELKQEYRHASIITGKRIVFNIKGNDYRLIVDIEFAIGLVFIVWIGTHADYDKIDVKKVRYEKAHKNRK